jgi:hypothetical protein
VANKSKLRERVLVDVEIDYKRIVLAIIEGKVYLMNAVCSLKMHTFGARHKLEK